MKKVLWLIVILLLTVTMLTSLLFVSGAQASHSKYVGDNQLQDKYWQKFNEDIASGVKQFDIYTADALYVLVPFINNCGDYFADCTISLKCDLIFNEGDPTMWETMPPEVWWTPIGTSTVVGSFSGTFDGGILFASHARSLRFAGHCAVD